LKRDGNPTSFVSSEVILTLKEYIPVRRLSGLGAVVVGDTADNYSANSPEHLQHLRSWRSQLDWRDLTAVCWRIGNENAPWDTLEKLGYEHDREGIGEVEDEDKGVQEHETGDGRPAVADAAGKRASQKHAHECAKWSGCLESRLPAGLDDLVALHRAVHAECFLERGQGDETTHNEDAVCLHDLEIRSAAVIRKKLSGAMECLTIVQDMTNAHQAAMGYSLIACITPMSCSAVSASMAASLYCAASAFASRLAVSSRGVMAFST
jgi:hypothetical protein